MPALPTGKSLALIGATGAAIYYVGTSMKDFKTPGIRNIEARHTSAGGAPNHTPATHTPMGKAEDVTPNQHALKGTGTKHFEENYGEQNSEKGELAKKWARTHHGSDEGPRG